MAEKSIDQTAIDEFIAELRYFYEDCGAPKYRELEEISDQIRKEYPDLNLQFLSHSGICDVLNGRRKSLPSAPWLATMILCCQRLALQVGAFSQDPGVDGLPYWQARLADARRRSRSGDGGPPSGGSSWNQGDTPEYPTIIRPRPAAPPSNPDAAPTQRDESDPPDGDAALFAATGLGEWALPVTPSRAVRTQPLSAVIRRHRGQARRLNPVAVAVRQVVETSRYGTVPSRTGLVEPLEASYGLC